MRGPGVPDRPGMTPARPRLSELGPDPDSALQVVRYFDALDDNHCSTADLVRSAALLAQCPVSVRPAGGPAIGYDGAGDPDHDADPATDVSMQRGGPPHPLDPVIIDRLRRILARRAADGVSAPRLGDPALVEVVISTSQDRADRGRAIRLLGFDESRDVRVFAVSAEAPEALHLVLDTLTGGRVRTAMLGRTTAVLYQGTGEVRRLSEAMDDAIATAYPTPLAAGATRGPWVGIGSRTGIFSAPRSWEEALRALRFASSTGYGRHVIAFERLSVLELLADLPAEHVRQNRDIARINEIAMTPNGALDVATVEAFCVYGSLRRTAEELHVHHSTVASRLAHLAERMGWDFDDPMDRFMATLVLMVRRISLSAATLAEDDLP